MLQTRQTEQRNVNSGTFGLQFFQVNLFRGRGSALVDRAETTLLTETT